MRRKRCRPPRATTSISPLAAFAELVGDDTTQLEISKAVFEHCQPVLDLVRTSTKQQTKYKYGARLARGDQDHDAL